MLSSLHDFVARLERLGELQQVEAMVDTRLEIAAITRRISRYPNGGPALLFRQPNQFPFPVATNLFGSRRRMRLALGLDRLEDLTLHFDTLLQSVPFNGLEGLGQLLADHPLLGRCRPVTVPNGPCREELEPGADLLRLPFLHNWPDDGIAGGSGRYITLGQVFTSLPDGSQPNCGIYRCQIHDAHRLAIRWRSTSDAARHHQEYIRRGERMPLAIVLGGPPALTLAAAWPLPSGLDELQFACWLRQATLPVVDCLHGPLRVPAEAELVIEGFAEPDQPLIEGPFGNHTGRYDPAGPAARITVVRITRREAPLIPATLVGPPPQEDCWMMLGWERLLAALLPRMVPEVRDIHLPLPWAFRQSAVVAIDTHGPRQVREILQALWALPWFATARLLVLVDAEQQPYSLMQTAWCVVNDTDWRDDLIKDETGRRLAINATCRHLSSERLGDDATAQLISQRWKEYGLP
jgi:4-hydroxy-3-polyprenylbenzoate decarboxylase